MHYLSPDHGQHLAQQEFYPSFCFIGTFYPQALVNILYDHDFKSILIIIALFSPKSLHRQSATVYFFFLFLLSISFLFSLFFFLSPQSALIIFAEHWSLWQFAVAHHHPTPGSSLISSLFTHLSVFCDFWVHADYFVF